MNDTEIISRFIKVEQEDTELKILVHSISWPHPHEPKSNWPVATMFPMKSSTKEIESKILEVLQDKRYFQICQECQQRKPCGWMHTDGVRQSCAERNHGIVY